MLASAFAASTAKLLLTSAPIAPRLRSNIAIYGVSADAQRVYELMSRSNDHRFVGLFEDRRTVGRVPLFGVPVAGDVAAVVDGVREGLIDEVIIALPAGATKRTAEIAAKLQQYPVDVRICLRTDADIPNDSFGQSAIGSLRLVPVHAQPIRDWGTIIKMTEDRIIGVCALVFALPLLRSSASPADNPGWPAVAPDEPRRAAPADQRRARQHVPGRTQTACHCAQ